MTTQASSSSLLGVPAPEEGEHDDDSGPEDSSGVLHPLAEVAEVPKKTALAALAAAEMELLMLLVGEGERLRLAMVSLRGRGRATQPSVPDQTMTWVDVEGGLGKRLSSLLCMMRL